MHDPRCASRSLLCTSKIGVLTVSISELKKLIKYLHDFMRAGLRGALLGMCLSRTSSLGIALIQLHAKT